MKEFFVEIRHVENGIFSIDENEFMRTVPETYEPVRNTFNVHFSESKATVSVEIVKRTAPIPPEAYCVGRSSGRTHKF